jgi:hypothetical protein
LGPGPADAEQPARINRSDPSRTGRQSSPKKGDLPQKSLIIDRNSQ